MTRRDTTLRRLEALCRVLLGAWLVHLSVGLALRAPSWPHLALGVFEGAAALAFMARRTARWGGALLLLSFAFAAGFHLRAGESPAPLLGYTAAVLVLLLASLRPAPRPSPLARADREFLRAFETARIAPADFHHREHIRAAWAVLRHYPLDEALHRYRAALKRLAARAGKPGIYHETITWAYLLLIHERLTQADAAPGGDGAGRMPVTAEDARHGVQFAEFAARNPDLMTWRPSILDAYYRKEDLDSEHARRVFVLPRLPRFSGGSAAAPGAS